MRCIRCMREIEDGQQICGFCKFPQDTPPENPDSLKPGTELRNRFLLGRELGRGGFGITYVGYDKYLDCKVAIKEYYPQALAARLPGETKVFWKNSQLRDSGCQNVIREAQKMHRLGILPVAVHVLDVFYENNTAYIAMDFVEGITLKQYLLKNGVLSAQQCLDFMVPIMDTMIQMHGAGIIHRDISPDNIMIQPDLKPRILDLGAAKDIQMESGTTTLVARNGFSPKEQYQTNGNIGKWTDVYALCATMYYSLTGKVPPMAMDRSEIDDTLSFHGVRNLPDKLCMVIQDGMRMCTEKRIPDMVELKKRLENSLIPDVEPQIEPLPVSTPPLSEPVIPQVMSTAAHLAEPVSESPKGFLHSLFAKFGKKSKAPANGPMEKVERKPTGIAISQPNAVPMYTDPNATVCLDAGDEDETVLVDSDQPTPANGVLVQNSTGKRIEITKCCFVLGRLTNAASASKQILADCLIEDSAKHISRRHAAILFNGEAFYLHDISGKNSTLLNGVRIQNGIMPENGGVFPAAYRLYDGDCIQLAEEKLTFHAGGGL